MTPKKPYFNDWLRDKWIDILKEYQKDHKGEMNFSEFLAWAQEKHAAIK